MTPEQLSSRSVSWFWPATFAVMGCALLGFSSGVSLTERPEVVDATLLTKAYYSLGLFVVGAYTLSPGGKSLVATIDSCKIKNMPRIFCYPLPDYADIFTE